MTLHDSRLTMNCCDTCQGAVNLQPCVDGKKEPDYACLRVGLAP
jgi:hypothetical protein